MEYKVISKLYELPKSRYYLRIQIIQWSDNEPTLDIRKWQSNKPLQGITIPLTELDNIIKALKVARKIKI